MTPDAPVVTAREAGLIGCRRCAAVWEPGPARCPRCRARLVSRDTRDLSRVWAWWIAGVMAYVPANLYPMLSTRTLWSNTEQTIVAGAVDLAQHGNLGIAAIILGASVLIPVAKFLCIAYLALAVGRATPASSGSRLKLLEVVDYIGRWSMIDVFVVAILSALVQLNVVASIRPGPAALAFALSVIFTMLSAQSFDPRRIWDAVPDHVRAPVPALPVTATA